MEEDWVEQEDWEVEDTLLQQLLLLKLLNMVRIHDNNLFCPTQMYVIAT